LLVLISWAGAARAHRLEADFQVLPGQRVQIEGWFDLSGAAAKGAKVEVFRPNEQLLTSGRLNDDGILVFSFTQAETLRVVVSAGAGHRKELTISEADLARSATGSDAELLTSAPGDSASSESRPRADRSPRISLQDVLVGVGFVLALAAFALSWRNARRLRELERG
jgi:nickel transport protein